MIQHIFLDLDDTIFDFKKAERIALSRTLREEGIKPTEHIQIATVRSIFRSGNY